MFLWPDSDPDLKDIIPQNDTFVSWCTGVEETEGIQHRHCSAVYTAPAAATSETERK